MDWMTSTRQQIRTFSSSEGGGGSGEGFRFRRPGGGGGGGDPSPDSRGGGFRNSSRNDGRGGGRGGGRFGQRQRRGGEGFQRPYNYGGAKTIGRGIAPPGGFRSHMIDVAVGNYRDDGPKRVSSSTNTPIQDEIDEEEAAAMDKLMADLHKQDQEYKAKKERWIQNSIPPVRVPVIDQVGRSFGRGARKTAHSGVWITPGFGNVTVNRMDIIDYFPRFTDRELLLEPFVVTRTCGKFDVQCQVRGGGKTGQAGAIRLGVARALQNWNPDYRPPMKKMGFLTRDARKVERKKIGKVKARKSPQWNRR